MADIVAGAVAPSLCMDVSLRSTTTGMQGDCTPALCCSNLKTINSFLYVLRLGGPCSNLKTYSKPILAWEVYQKYYKQNWKKKVRKLCAFLRHHFSFLISSYSSKSKPFYSKQMANPESVHCHAIKSLRLDFVKNEYFPKLYHLKGKKT